jgi:hypothetical protein
MYQMKTTNHKGENMENYNERNEEIFDYFVEKFDEVLDAIEDYPAITADEYCGVASPEIVEGNWTVVVPMPYSKRLLDNLHDFLFDCGGYQTWKNLSFSEDEYALDDTIVEAHCRIVEICADHGKVEAVIEWTDVEV